LSAALATAASASTSLLTTFLASASALATGLFAASFILVALVALVSLCHFSPSLMMFWSSPVLKKFSSTYVAPFQDKKCDT
jgi:hypothetical protein